MTHRNFSKALIAWRERNGFTQQEAADKLGVSRRSLENWEQERAMPQGFGLQAMIQIIGGPKARQKVKPQRKRAADKRSRR